jgi:hypothetical protein
MLSPLLPCQIYIHTALGVPPGPTAQFNSEPLYARATSSFFSKLWFSEVVLQAEAAGQAPLDQYAQLRLLLSFDVVLRSGREAKQEVAFVRDYRQLATKDVVTGFTRIRWDQQPERKQYRLVHITSILRLVHILPNFSSNGKDFFVNRFLVAH